MPVAVPSVLRRSVEGEPGGPEWLGSLSRRAARAVERWGLRLHEPFEGGMAAWTTPATAADGADLVLKLSFPHLEARDEAAALAAWSGSGAVEIIDHDAADHALLLRRVRPGTSLRDADLPPVEHLAAGADVLRRIASVEVMAGEPFRDLAVVAADLAVIVEERADRLIPAAPFPVDVGLCRRAVDLLRTLPAGADRVGLAHGDLNPGNILRTGDAASEPTAVAWVAIDPKPLHGDLAWDPWPLVTQVGDWVERTPDPRELAERTRLVADVVELDAPRIAAWCTARSVDSGLWAADRGWWTGYRGADGDLARAAAWSATLDRLGG